MGDLDRYTTDQLNAMHAATALRAQALYGAAQAMIEQAREMGEGRFTRPAYVSLMDEADVRLAAADEQHALLKAIGAECGRRLTETLASDA